MHQPGATPPAYPPIAFPASLPITEHLDEIQATIRAHQVLIVCGATGCGKSTQLPRICLATGLAQTGRIGHTQPRRIATQRLAERIATEQHQTVGNQIGYKVRFNDQVSKTTVIKLMTDGILLAEIQRDPLLREYSTLIIDEAHERSLNIDFLLGYLHQLLPQRPDLKLIITSATLEPERFAEHFGQAPIIRLAGRTYPVDIRYRPPEPDIRDPMFALQEAVAELLPLDGDILVFFAGERDIHEAADALRKPYESELDILPLYARQRSTDQARIFASDHKRRRLILATNVAETSLTVPGIRYVIDTGLARISRYSPRSKLQRLPIEPISQASAAQRAGRCGRVAPGVCIRLYSEADFTSRPAYTEPEILRTNLAAIILRMQALRLGDIAKFPFIQPPDQRAIRDGYRTLHELGAMTAQHQITRLGRKLARIPVDPRIGRMLLAAPRYHCLREILIIAAALAIPDPREPVRSAPATPADWHHPHSDFLTLLNLWRTQQQARQQHSRRAFHAWCQTQQLAPHRIREWHALHQQLQHQMQAMHYRPNTTPASEDQIHQAILSGLLSQIGLREQGQNRIYQGARQQRIHLTPGAYKTAPRWLMAAELIETQRIYARQIARIKPDWLEAQAQHLLHRTYAEPEWHAASGRVITYETLHLYGLPIANQRRKPYAPHNPAHAREIFIQHALVLGDARWHAPFWQHNQTQIAAIQVQEAKVRRHDLLIDDSRRYDWYNARVPANITDTRQLERWLQQPSHAHTLHHTPDDLRTSAPGPNATDYPDHLLLNETQLPLQYKFAPGDPQDGISVQIPHSLLPQLSQGQADWLIPGLIQVKLTALLKSLPKPLRRACVPLADTVRDSLARMQPEAKPLHQTFAAALRHTRQLHIPEDAWQPQTLEPYLHLRICVMDGTRELATSRDLADLQCRYGQTARTTPLPNPTTQQQCGLRDWSCGPLPKHITIQQNGLRLRAYPALTDEGDSVAVRHYTSAEQAAEQHQHGLIRLLILRQPRQIRDLRRNGPDTRTTWHYNQLPTITDAPNDPLPLPEQLIRQAMKQAFISQQDPTLIRDATQYNACYEQGKTSLYTTYQQIHTTVCDSLALHQRIHQMLSQHQQVHQQTSVTDVQNQLHRLLYAGFVQHTPVTQLLHYPRYLQAIIQRLNRLNTGGQARDQQQMQTMADIQQRWQQRSTQQPADPRLMQIRWQLEELRVSLFAQQLGTPYPISVRRIEKTWQQLGL
jgi:ATP-dependent helicase HrpA